MQNVQLIYICTFRLIYIWNLECTIKLGEAAFNCYDNNKKTSRSWRELKQHLLDRFKQSRSTPTTQLKERKQQPGETLIAYYDDILDLCKQVDNNIPLNIIVDYLQDGLRHELKIHIKRQLKALNDEPTPAMFSKIACDEEELHITTPTVLPNKSRLNHSGTQDDKDLINHIYINILIDSGSSITIIHHHFLQRIHRNTFEPTRPSYI
ncbi:unnamed protein product [Rotaria magnacalcarata]|uniref:Retrotransposon gag domain-containing protein n=1 Tax=Rotaria magnacalcarata TaxID=392030 RepID=A0A820P7Y9_9BILA|nr:unnamed protein product [Rotaria magnacalcarata]